MSHLNKAAQAGPRLPDPPAEYNKTWMRQFIRALELQTTVRSQPLHDGYAVTNVTEQRTLDGAAGTLADVRSVLATLIADLKENGVLKD